ncbi:MAG: ATP-binding protein, partial [Rhodoferax sp.]
MHALTFWHHYIGYFMTAFRARKSLAKSMRPQFRKLASRRGARALADADDRLFLEAINVIDEAFVLYDSQDRLVYCNQKYRDTFSDAHLMVPGARFEDIVRQGAAQGLFAGAVGREETWIAERLAAHRSGNAINIQKHENGRTLRVIERRLKSGHTVGFRIDITDLVQATEAARNATAAKNLFLATMSHEIRTPMNGILGMAQLLLQPHLQEDVREDYARTILSCGQSLLTLLNDILDLSKVEAGKFELESVPFLPRQLIGDITALVSETAKAKGLQILAHWHGAPDQCYRGDPHRLRQMLTNLVSNAVKFSETGSISVDAREVERDDVAALVELSVSDTGIGIAPERLQRLFQPYSQAESSTARQFGGSGLGLSIVRTLAQLMGGDVGVQSEVGKGSRFWFRVRLEYLAAGEVCRQADGLVDEDGPAGTRAAPMAGRVLLVEDNPINRKVAEAML